MSEEGCIGSPFQFLVARVIAGGWLCCEDNMFPLFPVTLQFQKVSLQELEMYAEHWLPRQMLHTGRQRAAQRAWQLTGGWPSPRCLHTPSPVLARPLLSPSWKRQSNPAMMEVSGEKENATKAVGAIFPISLRGQHSCTPFGSWCLVENPGGSSSLKHYLQHACTFLHLNQATWIRGQGASSAVWQLGANAAGHLCLERETSPGSHTRARMKGQSAPSYLCTSAQERTAACKIRQALSPNLIPFSDIQQRNCSCQVTTGNGLKQIKSLSINQVAHLQAASYKAAVQS